MRIVKTYKEVIITKDWLDNKERYMMFIKTDKYEYSAIGIISEHDTKNGLKTNYLYDLEISSDLFNTIKLTSGIFSVNRNNDVQYFGNVVTYKK